MPSSPWHTLLIGRELHTCNSTCFFLTLHLAVSTEASAWLSTNDLVLFSTLTSGDAFVSNHKTGVGVEDRKHSADQMDSSRTWKIGWGSQRLHIIENNKFINNNNNKKTIFFTPWDSNIAAQIEIPPHCRETWRGGMSWEERKENVSTGFSCNSHFYKSMGGWGGSRREALLRERKQGRKRKES